MFGRVEVKMREITNEVEIRNGRSKKGVRGRRRGKRV